MAESIQPFLDTVDPNHPWHEEAQDRIESSPLETLLSVLQDVHGRQAIEKYLEVLDSDSWNTNHGAIASLGREGYLRECITLNFDLLIEEAMMAYGGTTETLCPLADSPTHGYQLGNGLPELRVVKPHGSVAAKNWPVRQFDLLAATLDEIGTFPQGGNIAAIEPLIKRHPVLLVAGYSDHDWDIWPIFQRNAHLMQHVHWVHYVEPDAVQAKDVPPDGRLDGVLSWLQQARVSHTVWIGDVSKLLTRLSKALSCRLLTTPEALAAAPRAPNGDVFRTKPNPVEGLARTALATALLWQDRRGLGVALREWLHRHDAIRHDDWLHARLHRTSAQTEHTSHRLSLAMKHVRASINLKLRAQEQVEQPEQPTNLNQGLDPLGGDKIRGLGDDLFWLGYEHLCLIKRPSFSAPWAFLRPKRHFKIGRRFQLTGLRLSAATEKYRERRMQAQSLYYLADLRHAWAELWTIAFPRKRERIRASYQAACRKYERAAQNHPWLFEEPYYWLRRIEARVFGGVISASEREQVRERFDEIVAANRILHSHVQAGNAYLYQALILFHDRADVRSVDRYTLDKLLSQAHAEWGQSDAEVASGLRRIAMYRRLFGFWGLGRFVWELVRLRLKGRRRARGSQLHSEGGELELNRCAAELNCSDAKLLQMATRVIGGNVFE